LRYNVLVAACRNRVSSSCQPLVAAKLPDASHVTKSMLMYDC